MKLFTWMLLLLSCTACKGSSDLQQLVMQANEECPVTLPGLGQVSSVQLADSTLTYNCLVQNRSFNLEAFVGHEDDLKDAFRPMLGVLLSQDDNRHLREAILDSSATLAIRYYNEGDAPRSITVSFTPAELRQAASL